VASLLLRQWRTGVLVVLLAGPPLVYVSLGMWWLWQQGWVACTVAAILWVVAGVVFSVLAARWTKTERPLLPPLDWDSPQTFSPRDRDAWKLVQAEADQGETIAFDVLLGADVYIDTGRRLFRRLGAHYHPLAANPLDDVPIVELLTALELAAEDLSGLSRQVPGGDLVALAHWRKAVQVAGYITRANDLYAYIMPFLNPVSGLARLGTREWIVKPAWKSMQQNVLRWFYQAYVNRLGMHLIELLSGRLAIGTQQYRRLARRAEANLAGGPAGELKPLAIAVTGAVGAGKSRLIAMIGQAFSGDPSLLKARALPLGFAPGLLERLMQARWVEAADYPASTAARSRNDRHLHEAAVAASVECDLLILVVDGCRQDHAADIAFAKDWEHWFREHPHREVPPALVVITGVDRPEFTTSGASASMRERAGAPSLGSRDEAVRTSVDSLRALFPLSFNEYVAVGLSGESASPVVEQILPALAPLVLRAERGALIRQLHEVAGQSKVRRLFRQLGEHGRSLLSGLKAGHHARTGAR
jgi:uncharacterized protein